MATDRGPSDPPPRRPGEREKPALAPHLRVGEVRRGSKPGTRYVRVTPAEERPFQRRGQLRWEATLAAERPRTGLGKVFAALRHLILGQPLATSRGLEQRLSKLKALAVFSSDALSSTAYATEEILLVLVLAGTGYLYLTLPISIAIAVVLLTVVVSYQQAIKAYPQGGGAYTVASENISPTAGLIAASALLVDYILTVAVSVSAGVAAILSAIPGLVDLRIELAVGAVILLTAGNLRGVRESGTIFAIPTYAFVAGFAAMLAIGVGRLAFGDGPGSLTQSAPPRETVIATQSLMIFLVLRAFSSGAVALSGVEAMANGVPAFKPPEAKNASITLLWMGAILGVFFIGSAFLATRFGIVPLEHETVISQIARITFGGENAAYYYLQATTALILVLAANTAFNGFPILASILARDGYMPHQFAFRGDRLAFSYGIIVLAAIAAALLIGFQADTHRLIPLYAIGVFLSFTLSQAGLVIHWRRTREPGWRRSAVINSIGTVATGVVLVIVTVTKFLLGAWVVMILMPLIAIILYQIHRHYSLVSRELAVGADGIGPRELSLPPDRPVIVPVGDMNKAAMRAVAYARGISNNVTAVHLATEEGEDYEELETRWQQAFPDVPLVILESPYRSFQAPFLAFIDTLVIPENVPLTIVVPEFVPAHWWEGFLHNQTAKRLRSILHKRPNTIVINVTYPLED